MNESLVLHWIDGGSAHIVQTDGHFATLQSTRQAAVGTPLVARVRLESAERIRFKVTAFCSWAGGWIYPKRHAKNCSPSRLHESLQRDRGISAPKSWGGQLLAQFDFRGRNGARKLASAPGFLVESHKRPCPVK